MKHFIFLSLLILSFTSCKQESVLQEDNHLSKIDTLASGYLAGYLKDSIDVRAILINPPSMETIEFSQDSLLTMQLYNAEEKRKELAVSDAVLTTQSFEQIVGIELSMEKTPHAYIMMQRIIGDVIFYSGQAKSTFHRLRPYEVLGIESCWPDKEHKGSFSYPSGHAMIGQTWGLVFSSLFPDHVDRLMDRGRAYAESRVVCGVHWYEDIIASEELSKYMIAQLLVNEEFLHDLDAASAEIERLNIE